MKCGRHFKPSEANRGFTHFGLGSLDARNRARDHDLFWGVVVCDADVVPVQGGEHFFHRLQVCRNRGHGTRLIAGCRHQFTTAPGHSKHIGLGEHARCVKCCDFAKAVTRDRIGTHTHGFQHAKQRQAGHANGGLSPLCGAQGSQVLCSLLVVEPRDGKDHLVNARFVAQVQLGCPIPGTQGHIKVHGHVCAHAQILAALTREYESHTASLGPKAKGRAIGMGEGGLWCSLNDAG